MKIILADKTHTKDISRLMLKDLESPDNRFPEMMISKLREHAQEDSVMSEFSNPNLISFLALDKNEVKGFIVGDKEDKDHAMIHYVTSETYNIKELLLEKFISFCKEEKMNYVITDTFEFFDNYRLFCEKNFILYKRENITPNLEMLWLKLEIN